MKEKELYEMVDKYTDSNNGFKPGAIIVGKNKLPEIVELFKGTHVESTVKNLYDTKSMEGISVKGMRLVIDKQDDDALRLSRQSGNLVGIRKQGADELYKPAADITNGIVPITRAALSNSADSEAMCEVGSRLAAFLIRMGDDGVWEKVALPELQGICDIIEEDNEDAFEFYKAFFQCTMDFTWHANQLSTKDVGALDKAANMKPYMELSRFVRTLPKEMRQDYIDHMESTGRVPEGFLR